LIGRHKKTKEKKKTQNKKQNKKLFSFESFSLLSKEKEIRPIF